MSSLAEQQDSSSQSHELGRQILICVAWPYSNGPRHIGHGAALIPADVEARYQRSLGADVLVVGGTDEFGTPNMVAAEKNGLPTKEFVDRNSALIRDDFRRLGMSYDWFTRTTSPVHQEIAQSMFANLADSGYIKLGSMMGSFDAVTGNSLPDRYVEGTCPSCSATGARGDQCDSCASLLDSSELIDPVSAVTKNPVEFRPTEQYFLDLGKLKDEIAEYIDNNDDLRKEAKRMSENLVPELRERAITRDIQWGIPLPDGYELESGEKRVLYVWFEAVIGYLSASIEWAREQGTPDAWKQWWEKGSAKNFYFMGKDNVPFHTIIWPAMLMARNLSHVDNDIALDSPHVIASTGNLNFGGDKFSTSRGNVAYIDDLLQIIGPDALRFYLIAAGPETKDSNFTFEALVAKTNNELIAKWGNMVSRTSALIQSDCGGVVPDVALTQQQDVNLVEMTRAAYATVGDLIEKCKFSAALKEVFELIAFANKYIVEEAPWSKESKVGGRNIEVLAALCIFIENVNKLLCPFIPHASSKISHGFGSEKELAPLPREITTSTGVEVLTGDYRNDISLAWTFTNEWGGNRLASGKISVFDKLDLEAVKKEFRHLIAMPERK